jgi:cell division protein FtsB
MPPEVLILFFGGLAGIGGIILAGQWIQSKRVEGGGAQQDMKHLADSLDSLRQEVRLLQDDVVGLDERLEFTERLLSRPTAEDADLDRLPGQQS